MLQDGKTFFLHIAAWESKQSSVHPVTLISGSCLKANATTYTDLTESLMAAEPNGCNVHAVNNASIITMPKGGLIG